MRAAVGCTSGSGQYIDASRFDSTVAFSILGPPETCGWRCTRRASAGRSRAPSATAFPPPTSRVVAGCGAAKRTLLLVKIFTAEEAQAAGFVSRIVTLKALDAEAAVMCARLAENASLTLHAA